MLLCSWPFWPSPVLLLPAVSTLDPAPSLTLCSIRYAFSGCGLLLRDHDFEWERTCSVANFPSFLLLSLDCQYGSFRPQEGPKHIRCPKQEERTYPSRLQKNTSVHSLSSLPLGVAAEILSFLNKQYLTFLFLSFTNCATHSKTISIHSFIPSIHKHNQYNIFTRHQHSSRRVPLDPTRTFPTV